jgi:hypothetical protein
MKKNRHYDDDIFYENFETRHSTEPNRPIIQLNLNVQGDITILPRTQLARNVFSDLNRTVNYNYYSNNLNTTVVSTPMKTYSDRKKENLRMNMTFSNDRENDGFGFLNQPKSNKISSKFRPETVRKTEFPKESVKRNLNESFNMTLTTVRSTDNIFKKNNVRGIV